MTSSHQTLIDRYLTVMKRMKAPKKDLQPPQELSRPDILLTLKELKETVAQAKSERIQSFLGSKDLRLLMENQLVDALLRIVHTAKASERPSLASVNKEIPTHPSLNEEKFASKQTESEMEIPVFAMKEGERNTVKPLKEVLEDVEQTQFEAELIGKQKMRVELRKRSATLVQQDTFSAYIKIPESTGDFSDFTMTRRWLSIDPTSLSLYTSSSQQDCLLSVPTDHIRSVLDETVDSLKILVKEEESDLQVVFYTETMKARCGEVLRVIARVKGFRYVTEPEECSPVGMRVKRFLTYRTSLTLNPEQPKSPLSLSTDQKEASDRASSPSQEDIYLSDEGEEPLPSSATGITPQATLTTRPEDKSRSLTDLAEDLEDRGLVNLLTKGGVFLKYGRYGGPKLRHILVTADLKYIEWRPLNKPHYKRHSGIPVHSIKKVVSGRTTKRFKKFPNPAREEDSFSLICTERDLNLEVHKPGFGHNQRVWTVAFDRLAQGFLTRESVERFITKQHRIE